MFFRVHAGLLVLSLILAGCDMPVPSQTDATSPVAGVSDQAPNAPGSPAASTGSAAATFSKSDAVALVPAALKGSEEQNPTGFLPPGVQLSELSIVKASLDGREIPASDLRIAQEADGTLAFFLKKSAFDERFAGQGQSSQPSIHSSQHFQVKAAHLRQQVMQQFADNIPPAPAEKKPKPPFLTASVRGEDLTRQKIGILRQHAEALARESIFMDRNFYVVLSAGNRTFQVSQQQAGLIFFKFGIQGQQIQKLLQQQIPAGQIGRLPLLVERADTRRLAYFIPLLNLAQFDRWVIIEELEAILEYEIGPELSGRAELDVLDFNLETLELLERALPNLSQTPDLRAPDVDIETLLTIARQKIELLRTELTKFGYTVLGDEMLFTDEPNADDIFAEFDASRDQAQFKEADFIEANPDLAVWSIGGCSAFRLASTDFCLTGF